MQNTFSNSILFMCDNCHKKKSFLNKKKKVLWQKYLISLKLFRDYEKFSKLLDFFSAIPIHNCLFPHSVIPVWTQ